MSRMLTDPEEEVTKEVTKEETNKEEIEELSSSFNSAEDKSGFFRRRSLTFSKSPQLTASTRSAFSFTPKMNINDKQMTLPIH